MIFYIFRFLKRIYVFFKFKELKNQSCQTEVIVTPVQDKACQTHEIAKGDYANAKGEYAKNSINSINLINMRNFEDKNIQTEIKLSDICNDNEWSNLIWSKSIFVGSKPNLLDI
jgi:hypothetical protein